MTVFQCMLQPWINLTLDSGRSVNNEHWGETTTAIISIHKHIETPLTASKRPWFKFQTNNSVRRVCESSLFPPPPSEMNVLHRVFQNTTVAYRLLCEFHRCADGFRLNFVRFKSNECVCLLLFWSAGSRTESYFSFQKPLITPVTPLMPVRHLKTTPFVGIHYKIQFCFLLFVCCIDTYYFSSPVSYSSAKARDKTDCASWIATDKGENTRLCEERGYWSLPSTPKSPFGLN